jgi:hypothetical protein
LLLLLRDGLGSHLAFVEGSHRRIEHALARRPVRQVRTISAPRSGATRGYSCPTWCGQVGDIRKPPREIRQSDLAWGESHHQTAR